MAASDTANEKPVRYSICPGHKQSEIGKVPNDWCVRPVGEMGDVRAGKALAANAPGKLRPYLRTMNVFDGQIVLDDVLHMPMTDDEFGLYRLKYGDVLLNEGQSLELVGRCAMYCDEYGKPCAIQNALVRFRAREATCPKFATYLFRYCQATGVFAKIALQTTSVAHLGVSRFAKLELPWPHTLTEQEAIAEALGDADALVESLERLLAKKRNLKQAAMQQLLTGKKRLPGFEGEWEIKKLAEIGEAVAGLTYAPSDVCGEGGTLVLRASNVANGTLVYDDSVYVSMELPTRVFVQKGDILICVRNGSRNLIGKCAQIDAHAESSGHVFGAFMAVFRSEYNDFVYHHFKSGQIKKQIHEHLGATINQITNKSLNAFEIPFPSQEEQSAIAEVLSDMDAEITAIEAKIDKARQIKAGMMQELLTGKTRLI
ncbi:Type-1 restriction enzyme EcoKI specificity protein [Stieleria magnilauensis]|uniref:Type-1 restriction enzyme EcoKI specificity protein n=2 Tax=Stieleria magnilauensis TaxID=2527963 RepID=A0ABX5XU75_9BACT|nr:Type-1 restriction enzyme EcoKI specificity protein [Planctomycetes bacterium TBK1r]